MIDRKKLQEYGVQNTKTVLSDESDLILNAAVEILVVNYEHGIARPDLQSEEVGAWCTISDVLFTSDFAGRVIQKANELYMDNDFRKNVFAAMSQKWYGEHGR